MLINSKMQWIEFKQTFQRLIGEFNLAGVQLAEQIDQSGESHPRCSRWPVAISNKNSFKLDSDFSNVPK